MGYPIRQNKPNYQLANFYHGTLYSPTFTTLCQAIRNDHLITWPAIESFFFFFFLLFLPHMIHMINTMATDLGYMDQERKNFQSSK